MNQATDTVVADDPMPSMAPARVRPGLLSFAPELSALFATLWVYRDVLFRGLLPGNIGDARWTIALHEHWYRVWQGRDAIRDLQYYYPLHDTLGTSDAFLVQGQLYSIARLFGADQINSWVFAQIAFFLIAALGVALLAKRLLASIWLQVAFVVLTCASYPVLVALGHVQLIGLLAVSWVFVALSDVVTRRHVRRGIALLVVVPPLLALSSWYAFMLLAIVLAFLALALLVVSSWHGIVRVIRQVAADLFATLKTVLGVALVVLLALGWAAVLWVYLPSRSLLPPPGWLDVVTYSPRWSDIWNADWAGGGVWFWLYNRIYDPATFNFEQARGFTPILFAAFFLFGLFQVRAALLGRRQGTWAAGLAGRSGVVAAWLTVFAVIALFLMDQRGLSLYRFAWSHVPGLESVRAPFRVMTLLYGFAVFVVLRSMEIVHRQSELLRSAPWRRGVAIGLAACLTVALFVEMQRPLEVTWTRSQFLSPALLAEVDAAQKKSCDAVMLVDEVPDDPPWVNPIEAVVFSVVSGIPTPQGYSRADPVGYPGMVGDGTSLAEWMRQQGFDGRICRVSSHSVDVIQGL